MGNNEYEDNPAASYQASQIKVCAKVNQVKEPHEPPVDKKIVMVTIPYTRSQNQEFKDCLRMRVDTCADINVMPLSVYQTIFNHPKKENLMPTGIQVTTYNDSTLNLLGRCTLYPKTQDKITATFYVTQEEGSVLLSCSTSLKLEVIQVPEQEPVPSICQYIQAPWINQISQTSMSCTRTKSSKYMTSRIQTG